MRLTSLRALILASAIVLATGCGGGDSNGNDMGDTAQIFKKTALRSCFRSQGLKPDDRTRGSFTDFNINWPTATAEVSIRDNEKFAQAYEKWLKGTVGRLGGDEGTVVRYSNVVLGFEKSPTGSQISDVEKCLS